jgi:hypothetical protein
MQRGQDLAHVQVRAGQVQRDLSRVDRCVTNFSPSVLIPNARSRIYAPSGADFLTKDLLVDDTMVYLQVWDTGRASFSIPRSSR